MAGTRTLSAVATTETPSVTRDTKPSEPNAPLYVKILFALHLFCITVWAIPRAPQPQMDGKVTPRFYDVGAWIRLLNNRYLIPIPPLQAYLFESGTWQYWDMFSPEPASTDIWVDAEIIYRNGAHRYYLYPRMFTLPIPNKYAQERYRKFLERGEADDHKSLWPQVGLRIAYLNDNPANPPYTVRLTRHWLKISLPWESQAKEYSKYTYFEYAVDQRMLARMRSSPN